MNIIILGPPGVGKGTQGELLAQKLNLPRLSVGAILRRTFEEKHPEGLEAGKYMSQGLNTPPRLLLKILKPWLEEHKGGFIVDSLPRTKEQLKAFKEFVKKHRIAIDKVFHLDISERKGAKRLLRRAEERRKRGESRIDDTKKAIKKRYMEYAKDIGLILEHFRRLGVLEEIDGEKPINKVHQEILSKMR